MHWRQSPALIERIVQRSNMLGGDVTRLLELGYRRHLQRHQLLSELYQCQMYLQWIGSIAGRPPIPMIR